MSKPVAVALYLVVMIAVVVGTDLAFFRNRTGPRLIANIGIVAVFVAVYFTVIRAYIDKAR